MHITDTAKNFSDWLDLTLFYLMRAQGESYALFTHQIHVHASPIPIQGSSPAAIGMRADGDVHLLIYYPMVKHLSLAASAELFKHEILHIIFGHISGRYRALIEKYGHELVNVAMDLVVNQHCNEAVLRAEGMPGVTVEHYKLPPDQTTEFYCNALSSMNLSLKGFDMVLAPETDNELAEELTAQLVTKIKNEAERRKLDDAQMRGWNSAEALEFIEQARRKPTMPWPRKLKRVETRLRSEKRVPTPLRASRRHPEHLGRLRVGSLLAWAAVDTSGSMGKEELKYVDAELKGMHTRGAVVRVVHCDAEIVKEELYSPHRGLTQYAGRGGTDFSPVLLKLHHTPFKQRPALLVFYTDGYGGIEEYARQMNEKHGKGWKEFCNSGSTKTPEGVELLWLLVEGTTSPEDFKEVAPFGDIAVVPRDKEKNESLDSLRP